MSNNVSSFWTSYSKADSTSIIIPDGCRDLILMQKEGQRPHWFISPLFDQSKFLKVDHNIDFIGFRVKPGTVINEEKLLLNVQKNQHNIDDVENLINDFSTRKRSVIDAILCLSDDGTLSVNHASQRLGVNIRSLQRLVNKNTGRTPSYWFQLARVRRAGKALASETDFTGIAYTHGFSDHAHMCREFKRWFNLSPTEIHSRAEITQQLKIPVFA